MDIDDVQFPPDYTDREVRLLKRFERLEERLKKLESQDLDDRIGDCFAVIKFLPKTWDHLESLQEKLDTASQMLCSDVQRLIVLEGHKDNHYKMLDHLKAMIDAHTDLIDTLNGDMEKMHDAYYQVFPERLAQDVRFMKQIDAITSKPESGAKPKKP